MAIAYVGGQVAGRSNPTAPLSVNFALSGGLDTVPSAGDLVIVTCVTGSAAGNPAMAVATPADYTPLGQLNQAAATNDTSMDVSYKFMTATPDTAVTIPGTTNNAWGEAYTIQVFRGVDPTSPMDVTPVPAGGTATARPDPGSINWTTAGTWVVICGGGATGTGANYVAPANYTTNFLTAFGADTTDAIVGSGYRTNPADPEDPAAYTGGTALAANSWASYTLALRPASDAVSVGVTGEEGASALGTLAASIVLALSGVVGTGAVSTFTPTATVAISGEAATGSVGTLAPSSSYGAALGGNFGTGSPGSLGVSVSVPLTGEAGTGAEGTLGTHVGLSAAITGNAGTGAAGSVVASVSVPLTGEAGTGGVGTLVPSAGFMRALTGEQGTGDVGTLAVNVSTALSGVSGTGSPGTITGAAVYSVALTGVLGTGGEGSLATGVSVALGGEQVTGDVGTIVGTGPGAIIAISGVQGTGTAGVLAPSAWTGLDPTDHGIRGTRWDEVKGTTWADALGTEWDEVKGTPWSEVS